MLHWFFISKSNKKLNIWNKYFVHLGAFLVMDLVYLSLIINCKSESNINSLIYWVLRWILLYPKRIFFFAFSFHVLCSNHIMIFFLLLWNHSNIIKIFFIYFWSPWIIFFPFSIRKNKKRVLDIHWDIISYQPLKIKRVMIKEYMHDTCVPSVYFSFSLLKLRTIFCPCFFSKVGFHY